MFRRIIVALCVTALSVGAASAAYLQPLNRNLAINGNFSINQRAYATGGSVASNGFAFDHWYNPGGSATSYSFTAPGTIEGQASAGIDTTITIAANGAIAQKIEERQIAGGVYTLNCTGTATAAILYINNSTATAAASGTCGTPLSATIPVGTTVVLQFGTGSGTTATLGLVEFDAGSVTRPFERRQAAVELQLCQRYYQIAATTSGAWTATNTVFVYGVAFPVTMRATPTATLVTAGTGITDPGTANYGVTGVNSSYTNLTQAGGYIGLGTAASTAYRPGDVQSNVVVSLSAEF